MFRLFAAARRHDDFVPLGRQTRYQMAPDESAAAHDHDALRCHGHSALAVMGSTTTAPRGATTPKRAVSDTGAAPNACA